MNLVHQAAGGQVVYPRGSETSYRCHLALCAGEARGYHHVAFELTSPAAVDEAEARVRRQGTAIETKIDNEKKRSFFLVDPDGLRSEYLACRRPGYPDLATAAARERPYLI